MIKFKLTAIIFLIFIGFINSAFARNIDRNEMQSLVKEGIVIKTNDLEDTVLDLHLGAVLQNKVSLRELYGRYVCQFSLLDVNQIKWFIDLDAQTGEVISNKID